MNNSICYTTPTHYNARPSTHLREMTLLRLPSSLPSSVAWFSLQTHHNQPPLSSCTIACYKGAVDGGRDGMKGMESGGLKIHRQILQMTTVEVTICTEVMHDTCNKINDFHKLGQKVWNSYSYSGAQVMFGSSEH